VIHGIHNFYYSESDSMSSNRMHPYWGLWVGALLTILLLLACTAGESHAGSKTLELEAVLQTSGPEDEVRVIVRFTQRADIESLRQMPRPLRRSSMIRELQAAAEHGQQEIRLLLQERRVKDVKTLWSVNALALHARPEVIYELSRHPDVESIQVDRAVHKDKILLQSFAAPEPNIAQIGANDLWSLGYHGQGAVVALMDTGADVNHPDLSGTWRGGTNSWLDPYNVHPLQPFDDDGHGTAVLGIMVGGDFSGSTIGAAPAAKWIAAKMFNDDGFTYYSVIHQLFQWFLDPDGNPDTDDAPDVVNGSWGFEDASSVGKCFNVFPADFQPDIDALNAAGIAVVFAAGNAGPNPATSISPANYPGVIAVGSITASNVVDSTSGRGPGICAGKAVYPDVVAPGVSVKTTDLSFGGLPNYAGGTGTSLSAPHASGVLALLRSAFPAASLDQLKAALAGSAADLPANAPDGADDTYGNGLIDAGAAFSYLSGSGLTPCVRPDIDFSASPFPASPNQLVTFTATVAGGTPPYVFAWDFDGDGSTDCDTAQCAYTYATPFSGTVRLTVADSLGCEATVFIEDGWAACSPISVGFTLGTSSPVTGQPVTFTSSITGGTAPFSYEWDLDGDGIVDCTTATCTKTYGGVFNGTVTLKVADRYGCAAEIYSAPVSVAAAPSSSGGGGGGGGGGCFIAALAQEGQILVYHLAFAFGFVGLGIMLANSRSR
jgi:subtilisin family serine protease